MTFFSFSSRVETRKGRVHLIFEMPEFRFAIWWMIWSICAQKWSVTHWKSRRFLSACAGSAKRAVCGWKDVSKRGCENTAKTATKEGRSNWRWNQAKTKTKTWPVSIIFRYFWSSLLNADTIHVWFTAHQQVGERDAPIKRRIRRWYASVCEQ